MIIVDTSIIVAFVNAGDDHHDAVTDGSTLPTTTSRPPVIVAEVDHLKRTPRRSARLSVRALDCGLEHHERAPLVQRAGGGCDRAILDAAQEVGLRLDGRGALGALGQVQERADASAVVGEGRDHAAVHHAARSTALRRPADATADEVGADGE